jgi:RNA polymerase sigma factor (sigma-70 family)
LPLLELISEGNIGLIKAARRFDPARGVRFASYARCWIEERIFFYTAEAAGIFRLPPKTANIRYRIGATLSRRTNLETKYFLVSNCLRKQLHESLQMLSTIEQRIIRLRFGLDDGNPLTLAKIGQDLNLSRERIRQIEKEALLKMCQSSAFLATYLR